VHLLNAKIEERFVARKNAKRKRSTLRSVPQGHPGCKKCK